MASSPGPSTTYTTTVTAVNAFAGTTAFSLSGLPTGALADTESGGWTGRWSGKPQSVALSRLGRALTLPAHGSAVYRVD